MTVHHRPFRPIEALAYAAVLAGALAAYYAPVILSGKPLCLRELFDHSAYFAFYPWDLFTQACLREATLPLWNPFQGCGTPHLANYQSSVLFPLKALLYPFPLTAAALPGVPVLDLYFYVRLLIGGVATAAFLRRLQLSRAAALVGSVAFVFSSYLVVHADMAHLGAEVLIPVVLWALDVLFRRNDALGLIPAALAVAAVLLGGHPESAFFTLLFAAAWGLFEVALRLRFRGLPGAGARGAALRLVAAFALGLLLAAPQLLPFLEYLPRAWHVHVPGVGTISQGLGDLPHVVAPGGVSPSSWSFVLAPGALVTALAGFAVLGTRSVATRGFFFAAWAVAFGGLFFGLFPFSLLGRLPLLRLAGNIKYPCPSILFATAALAAIGFDFLTLKLARGDRCRSFVVACLAPLVLLAVATGWALRRGWPVDPGRLVPAAAALASALVLFAWARRGAFRYRAVALGVLALLAVDVAGRRTLPFKEPYPAHPMTPPPDWVPELPGEGVLPARFTGGSPHFSPNLATCYRLSDVQSRDALYVDDHFRFLADVNGLPDYRTVLRFPPGQTREEAIRSVVDGPPTDLERFWFGNGMATGIEPRGFESPLLDLMGVRYLLFSPEYRGPDPPADRFELSASGPGDVWRIYRRRGPLGRAFVVHGSEVHAERSALEARRRDPAFDWRSTVLLDRGPVRPPAAAAPGEEVEVVEHAPNRVRLRARLAAEGFVVLADTWFPGWRVRVGGRPAEALEAYGAFRAVPLPAGEHLVEFRYLPASFLAGVALAGAAALGLAGYGVRAFRVRGAPARAPLPYGSG